MRVIEFPYTLYKSLPVPIIPVQIQNRGEWFELWAFVDTGATFSIFGAREAEGMGLDLSQALKRYIVVGYGSFIPASFVQLPMRIGEIELKVEVGFSGKLGVGFNLLGRKDVFNAFRVCFSDDKKIISFNQD